MATGEDDKDNGIETPAGTNGDPGPEALNEPVNWEEEAKALYAELESAKARLMDYRRLIAGIAMSCGQVVITREHIQEADPRRVLISSTFDGNTILSMGKPKDDKKIVTLH